MIGKRDSYGIVAQLSPEFTARLVYRWQELEGRAVAPQFAIPQTPPDFLEPDCGRDGNLPTSTTTGATMLSNKSEGAADEAAQIATYGEFTLCKAFGVAHHVAAVNRGAKQSVVAPRVVAAKVRSSTEMLCDKVDHLLKSLREARHE